MDREKFEVMRREYYAARGWTPEGRPLTTTLMRLGLEDILPRELLENASPHP